MTLQQFYNEARKITPSYTNINITITNGVPVYNIYIISEGKFAQASTPILALEMAQRILNDLDAVPQSEMVGELDFAVPINDVRPDISDEDLDDYMPNNYEAKDDIPF